MSESCSVESCSLKSCREPCASHEEGTPRLRRAVVFEQVILPLPIRVAFRYHCFVRRPAFLQHAYTCVSWRDTDLSLSLSLVYV